MPMVHDLQLLPTGVSFDGTEIAWVDKFVASEWISVRMTTAEIAVLASVGAALLAVENAFTKNQRVAPTVITTSGAYSANASNSNNFEITQSGNLTLNPTNLLAGMVLNFLLIQDGTGGRTITLNAVFKFAGGTVPTWITTAGAKNLISGYVDSSGAIICGGVVGAA